MTVTHDDVIYLIKDTPEAHGILDDYTPESRMVYCRVRSVGFNEFYTAKAAGLSPSIVFVLQHDFEYAGEQKCLYHGIEYRIIRTYVTETDGI